MYRILLLLCCMCSLFGAKLSPEVRGRIRNLVEKNPNQMKVTEYCHLSQLILSNPGANILVFGVGRDSSLYVDLNPNGRVVFLEDNQKWINAVRKQWPQLEIYKVSYRTNRDRWKELLRMDQRNKLQLSVPAFVRETNWDIIFVDAPAGYSDDCPGRMQSIYTAAQLACTSNGTHVLTHDSDRIVEDRYSMHFLKKENLLRKVNALRHFYIPAGSSMVSN